MKTKLSDEALRNLQNEFIYFFEQEHDKKIGVIAANEFISFFEKTLGKNLYNQGIEDAKKALQARLEELNYDLDDLQQIN